MNLKPLRRLVLSSTRITGAQRLFRLQSSGPIVLFYHGVEEHFVDDQVQTLHLPLPIFEKQIDFLRKNREVLSMDDLAECIDRRRLDSRHVVLTFDDGYKNNLRVVGPLLSSWQLPFTAFVSTRHISEGHRMPTYYIRTALLYTPQESVCLRSTGQVFDLRTRAKRAEAAATAISTMKRAPQNLAEKIVLECQELLSQSMWAELDAIFSSEQLMNWIDVNRIKNMGATIGSHCHDHSILNSSQDEGHALLQLQQSKSIIEKTVGPCRYLAYPNGKTEDISHAAYVHAKSAGFRLAFTTVPGEITPEIDCHFAPRIFGVLDYEEFCYTLNRTAKQNAVYCSALVARSRHASATNHTCPPLSSRETEKPKQFLNVSANQ
jgi:peptidoglycan/xylan/chitin deacetylase (PgdA/CDA1 family)